MKLKHLFIILCSVLFLATTENEETITWNENRKLTWADFKANPDVQSDAVALTASGITFGYSVKRLDDEVVGFNATVESLFYPNKSWYKKDIANNHILNHEQLHFDITELHARKLRQQVNQLKVSQNIKQQLEQLHKDINIAIAKMQHQYDQQSNHSINSEMQSAWHQKIREELKALERYKSK